MNNLLCRAKRLDNGEWVEGYYLNMTHCDNRHTHHFIIPLGSDLSKNRTIGDIQVEIDPATLCRCTGLKDKNDNLIWENNICKSDNKHIVKIIWNHGMKQWQVKICKTDYCLIRDLEFPLWQWDAEEVKKDFRHKDNPPQILEIIGNTIDNPELLEV